MTEQLPDDQMQLLVADAVRYRFLRDVVPAIINDLLADENYDWDKFVGFESIYYAKGDGTAKAKNGKELLEIYQKSLDQNGKSNFDAIITDIIMPPYNGDEAVKEIRAIEVLHKINNNEEIPIIAISGQGEKEDIYNLFKCQITDYFIKGTKPELLLRVIANYIN